MKQTQAHGGRTHKHRIFRVIRAIATLFFPHHKIVRAQPCDGVPSVYVCNHSKAYGPVVLATNFDIPYRPWVMSEVCRFSSTARYCRECLWPSETFWGRLGGRLLSWIAAPILYGVMHAMEAIPVYKSGGQVLETFRESVRTLEAGRNIVIYPESLAPYSRYINDLNRGFVDLARIYYSRTGKSLAFYPMYACLSHRTITIGQPVFYDPANPMETERERIVACLRQSITELAEALPPHEPIPFA